MDQLPELSHKSVVFSFLTFYPLGYPCGNLSHVPVVFGEKKTESFFGLLLTGKM